MTVAAVATVTVKGTVEGTELDEAEEIFSRQPDCVTPGMLDRFWDYNLGRKLIPFSPELLMKARRLGLYLTYDHPITPAGLVLDRKGFMQMCERVNPRVQLFDPKITWYADEKSPLSKEFLGQEMLFPGWRLVSRDVVKGTRQRDTITQLDIVVDLIKDLFGEQLPEVYTDAFSEFERSKEALLRNTRGSLNVRTQMLLDLKITNLFVETAAEVVYRLGTYAAVHGTKLLPNSITLTRTLVSQGLILNVGDFGENGMTLKKGNAFDGFIRGLTVSIRPLPVKSNV